MEHTQNSPQLISRQFRRKDEDYSDGFSDWEDMEKERTWPYLEQFLPDYSHNDDVCFSDDLSCVIEGGHDYKDLDWLYVNYPEYNGYSLEQVQEVLDKYDAELYQEAEEALKEEIEEGVIEVREFPITILSPAVQGLITLSCADKRWTDYAQPFTIPASNLQNVQSRVVDDTFQIYCDQRSSGSHYWCYANRDDFQ